MSLGQVRCLSLLFQLLFDATLSGRPPLAGVSLADTVAASAGADLGVAGAGASADFSWPDLGGDADAASGAALSLGAAFAGGAPAALWPPVPLWPLPGEVPGAESVSYPLWRTSDRISAISSRVSSYRTVAVPAAKFTVALSTPATLPIRSSTPDTLNTDSMSRTSMTLVFIETPYRKNRDHSMIYTGTVERLMFSIFAHRMDLILFFFRKDRTVCAVPHTRGMCLLHFHNQPPSNPARFNPIFM